MTSAKAHRLKNQFCSEFQAVFQLCTHVMDTTENAQLLEATLETLLKLIPIELDVAEAYAQGKDSDQVFISNLAQFLVAFLKEHTDLVEDTNRDASSPVAAMRQQVQSAHLLVGRDLCTNRIFCKSFQALKYLLKISHVEEVEVFKICLDFWSWLACELWRESPYPSVLGWLNFCTTPARAFHKYVIVNLRRTHVHYDRRSNAEHDFIATSSVRRRTFTITLHNHRSNGQTGGGIDCRK
ncbi:unnamed protein product [Sphagnum balticum]